MSVAVWNLLELFMIIVYGIMVLLLTRPQSKAFFSAGPSPSA